MEKQNKETLFSYVIEPQNENSFSINNNIQIKYPPKGKKNLSKNKILEYTVEKYGYLENYGQKIITFKPKAYLIKEIEKNTNKEEKRNKSVKEGKINLKGKNNNSHLSFGDNNNKEPNLLFETGGIFSCKNIFKTLDNQGIKAETSIYNKFTIETQNNYNYRNELSYSDLISEIIKYWKKNNIKVQNENFKIYAGPKLNFNINSQVIKLDKVNNCINNNILKNNRNDKDKNNKIDNVNKKEDFNDTEDDDKNNSYIEINETKTTVTKKTKSKNKNNSSQVISSTINSKSTTNIINNNDSNKIKSIPQPLNNNTIINTNNIKKFNRIYPSYKVINLKFLGKSPNKKNENKSIIINSTSKIIIPQKFRNIYPSYRVSNIKILGKEKKSSFNKIRTSYRVINLKFLRKNNIDNKKINVIENNRSKTPNRTLNNNIFKVNRVNNIKFLSKTPDKNLRKLGIRISYRVNNIKVIGKKAKKKFDFIIPKYRINTISFFPKNKFISSVQNIMAVKRIINLKFLSVPNYNKNNNNINEKNLCNCKCHNLNSNLNNNSNIKKENKEKNEKEEDNEKSKKKLITVQRQFHFTLEPEPNDIIRQRSITYKIDSLFKPKIPINRISNEIFLDIISHTEKIRISKNPISFQTSNINLSFLRDSSLKNNVNINKNFTRKISIFKPNWNFTNLISSEFYNFSIIGKNKNENNFENHNNLKSDLKEKNNEELNNNLIKKKNTFNICNNYQIELKGNNKDENYDKIKLEIKSKKKNLDFEDFIQEDLFDKDNYYIFINNNKEIYNFEYDNYPSFDEMKLKYNKFISSINENERNPYIIPRNNFLEIMKKIWDIENKENTLNLNIEYISKLNDNISQNLMINIANEKQNKNWLNHILVCLNETSIQINNDIKTLAEKKDEIINVDLLEIPNEKIYDVTKLKWIKNLIPYNENNFSLINLNTFIDDNSLKTNENNNINNKKIWCNLYIENTNFEILNNNILNSNVIEVNDNKTKEKIKNENKLLKSKNLKTNEEIAKIKLDLMNSLNKSNEKNPPLTTKIKNKKNMEINNNKLHRSMTKPQKDNIKENINERIKNRIDKNENQKKKKQIDWTNMSYSYYNDLDFSIYTDFGIQKVKMTPQKYISYQHSKKNL